MMILLILSILVTATVQQNVKYYSYTRQNTDYIEVSIGNIAANPNLSPNKATYFIAHGFSQNGLYPWIIEAKDELLIAGDYNVISIDHPAFFGQIPTSGEAVGQFYDYLASEGYNPATFHCSGHSLGAHLCGYSGQFITSGRLGRITGLDAAGPEYDVLPPDQRLDETDAIMVDCVHTDGGGSGYLLPLCVVDFFANNGSAPQPGCGNDLTGACSHLRAYNLFVESINSNRFVAKSCGNYQDFTSGACNSNPEAIFSPMFMSLTASGTYYMATSDVPPFAMG